METWTRHSAFAGRIDEGVVERVLAVGRDEVRHLDVAFHELANLSHQHVGGPGASLVLAEVLGPRLDDERLDEAIGVGEIAEQAPPLGAAATSISLDPGHRLGELARETQAERDRRPSQAPVRHRDPARV